MDIYIKMTPKEKYINYILDDLIKNTKIDYNVTKEEEIIIFPYLPFTSLHLHYPLPPHLSSCFLSFPTFSKYVQQKYGVRDEEIDNIWGLYKERILDLINR